MCTTHTETTYTRDKISPYDCCISHPTNSPYDCCISHPTNSPYDCCISHPTSTK